MQINYCFGCMEHIESYPCPHCGYAPSGNASAYTLRPGSILRGKYLVGKVLGQGGFGITYIGMDLALQRKVAIKEFYPSNCVGRESGTNRVLWYDTLQAQNAMQSGQETFLKEARKMSRVSNIGTVVHVFDVFQENETAYICMEFIEGQTLQQLLKQTGPLPWEKAKEIFLPVIQTMAQVHQQGLVHRDLSPDNLMIQRDGTVKILDLGAAKDLNLNTGVSSMQVAKSGFSPLEQYLSSGESGSWTDVYALAATLYYALTGVVPPTAVDRSNRDTLRWDLPQLQALPAEVRKALVHAMAVHIEDRTRTMEAFTAELQHIVNDSRFPGVRLAAVLLAVAVLVIVIVVAGFRKEAPPETLPHTETTEPIPETTDATPKITETAPETTETIPEMTKTDSMLTKEEAETLIADIAGKNLNELYYIYTEAVQLENFWYTEGLDENIDKKVKDKPVYKYNPLYTISETICGKKIYSYIYNESKTYLYEYNDSDLHYVQIEDTMGNKLHYTAYNHDNTVSTIRKSFYDANQIRTREVEIHYSAPGDISFLTDSRYETNKKKNSSINIMLYHDSYTIKVYNFNYDTILEKSYDSEGKLLSSP